MSECTLLNIDLIQNTPDNQRADHRHLYHEILQVRGGVYQAQVDNREVSVGPGRMLYYPAGVGHRPIYRLDGSLRLLYCAWEGPATGSEAMILDDPRSRLAFLLDWLWSLTPGEDRHAPQRELVFSLFINELSGQLTVCDDEPATLGPIHEIRRYFHQNLHRAVDLSEVARLVSWSNEHLIRRFRQATGVTPHRYLQQLRIDKAVRLLQTSELKMSAIADAVGMRGTSYLSTLIKRDTGYSPAQLRRG